MTPTTATRDIGDARVSVIQTGQCYFAPHYPPGRDWITPDTPFDSDRRMALLGINSLVLQTRAGTVVVDPCSFRSDETTLGGGSILEPGPSLDASLAALG